MLGQPLADAVPVEEVLACEDVHRVGGIERVQADGAVLANESLLLRHWQALHALVARRRPLHALVQLQQHLVVVGGDVAVQELRDLRRHEPARQPHLRQVRRRIGGTELRRRPAKLPEEPGAAVPLLVPSLAPRAAAEGRRRGPAVQPREAAPPARPPQGAPGPAVSPRRLGRAAQRLRRRAREALEAGPTKGHGEGCQHRTPSDRERRTRRPLG
mmetsp:Transcript_55775/g.156536  ORF Transcript_55775/g.156536 Transcript_55775/m.156536 type:complete len:215 (-) Transcript_55775:39-683(-)